MKLEISDHRRRDTVKVTRIEVKQRGKSKTLTLSHTDPIQLSVYLKELLSEVVKIVTVTSPITESPIHSIDKCSVQVYETSDTGNVTKVNSKTFTCYGINVHELFETIKSHITQ